MTKENVLFYSEFKSKINHDIKKIRVNALDELEKHVCSDISKLNATETENYLNLLIKCFKDNAEICREKSMKLVSQYVSEQATIDDEVSIAISLIVNERLGKEYVKETSEEIRCLLSKLLISLINKNVNFSGACLKNVIDVLINCLNDSYSEVKKNGFELTEIVAKKFPNWFPAYSEKITKSLLNCAKHKHFRIRVSAINCLRIILVYCDTESIRLVCGSLGECLLDVNVHVRIAILGAASFWLQELPNKYSYACYILPLILSCVSDESEECRKEAIDQWGKIGVMYMKDNEEKLKEKMEYLPKDVFRSDYDGTVPNYGCYALVSEQIARFLPAIVIELDDWRKEVQIRSAALLKATVVQARLSIVPFLDVLIPVLLKRCTDEEKLISKNMIETAEYIGKVVPPEIYWKVFDGHLKNGCASNHLVILSSLFKFTNEREVGKIINDVAFIFVQLEISAIQEKYIHQNLLEIFSKLLHCCVDTKLSTQIAYNVYSILLTAMSEAEEDTQLKTIELIDVLCKVSEFHSLSHLNQYSLPKLYDQFLETSPLWQSHSADLKLFLITLSHFSDNIFDFVPEKFIRICEIILQPSFDKEVSFKVLLSIGKSIESDKIKLNQNITVIEKFLLGPLKLQLIWSSGKIVEVVRNAALIIFNLYSERVESTNFVLILEFIPLLISLSDDNYEDTRMASLCAFVSTSRLLQRGPFSLVFFIKMLSAAIQRLEDISNRVRLMACAKIAEMFNFAPKIDGSTSKGDISASLKSIELLLVMSSDENEQVRNGIRGVLKQPSTMNFLRQLYPRESLNILIVKCRDEELALNLKTSLNI